MFQIFDLKTSLNGLLLSHIVILEKKTRQTCVIQDRNRESMGAIIASFFARYGHILPMSFHRIF